VPALPRIKWVALPTGRWSGPVWPPPSGPCTGSLSSSPSPGSAVNAMVRARFLLACVAAAAALVAAGCGTGGGSPTAAAPAAARGTSPAMPQASRTRGILIGVSCPSPSRCAAVGEYYQPRPPYALIERWDGSRWSILKSPAPSAHMNADLYGISCTTASDCTAVGSSARTSRQPTTTLSLTRTLVEHWNGSAWSIVKSPNLPVPSNQLAGVACTGASSCFAVGASGNSFGLDVRTLAERWTGSQWVIVKSPDPVGATYSFLSSISCTGSSNCVAVGEYFPGGHRQNQNHILIEHWNGYAWTVVASPKPPGSIASYLSAVSCTAESDCVAVGTARYSHRKGDSYGGPREFTLIEHWNGSGWAIVSSPDPPGPPADGLAGVACTSASDCTAVGVGGRLTPPGSADGANTLAEHWNGSAWSIVRSSNPSTNSDLNQVACTSASDCIAVGGFGDLDNPESPSTLAERWNGSAWSLVTPAVSK
jgi:hypothetical protein